MRKHISPEVIDAARRVSAIFDDGCDRCDAADLILLEQAGLMDQDVCSDTFGQDTLQVGDPMWVFNEAGQALVKELKAPSAVTSDNEG